MQRLFENISHKTLSNQLKELIEGFIVSRKVYPESPPKVEYSMTKLDYTLLPIIEMMYDGGKGKTHPAIKERRDH